MIREMRETDLPFVLQIEQEALPEHWQEKDFRYELFENPYAHLFVMEIKQKIVGFIDLWIIFERAEIASIATAPQFRRRGYAKKLLHYALFLAQQQDCEVAFLEVRQSNQVAKSLYYSFGFNDWRIKKDYYQNNHEDALEMIYVLGGLNENENISN